MHIFRFLPSFPSLDATGIIDILVVAFLVYQCLMVVRGTRAGPILLGILIMVSLYAVALWGGLEASERYSPSSCRYIGLAMIVLFQSEIRRTLARIGRKRWLGPWQAVSARPESQRNHAGHRAVLEQKTGALIVLERDIGLRTFVESGVRLDARSRAICCFPFSSRACRCTMAPSSYKRIAWPRPPVPAAHHQFRPVPQTRNAPSRRHRHHRRDRLPGAGGFRRDRAHLHRRFRRVRSGLSVHRSRRAIDRHFGVERPAPMQHRRIPGRHPSLRRQPAATPAKAACKGPTMMRVLNGCQPDFRTTSAWKLLSLGVPLAIWALVASEPELSTFATARVEYKNLPDDLEIASEPGQPPCCSNCTDPRASCSVVGDGVHPRDARYVRASSPGERTFAIGEGGRLPRGVRLVTRRSVASAFRFRDARLARERAGAGACRRARARMDTSSPAADGAARSLDIVGPASHVRPRSPPPSPIRWMYRSVVGSPGIPGQRVRRRSVCAIPILAAGGRHSHNERRQVAAQ